MKKQKVQISKEVILKLFPFAFNKADLRVYRYNPTTKQIRYVGKLK